MANDIVLCIWRSTGITPRRDFDAVREAVAIAVGIERIRTVQQDLLAIREAIPVGVRPSRGRAGLRPPVVPWTTQ
jgi:hypothetical protein